MCSHKTAIGHIFDVSLALDVLISVRSRFFFHPIVIRVPDWSNERERERLALIRFAVSLPRKSHKNTHFERFVSLCLKYSHIIFEMHSANYFPRLDFNSFPLSYYFMIDFIFDFRYESFICLRLIFIWFRSPRFKQFNQKHRCIL